MDNGLEEKAERLLDTFGLKQGAKLLKPEAEEFAPPSNASEQFNYFNIEWHIIPSAEAVPLDNAYFARFYPMAARDFANQREHGLSYREEIFRGHSKHQGQVIGVEVTQKPCYLPGNRQFYGTRYGFDATADPFAIYLGRAGITNGTRYAHNYLSLREFVRVVNEDWRARNLLPRGYRVTVCPPAIFNLVGTIFHSEWSETETLELGFYRDEQGNATCYAVGSNAPGDFSYINEVKGETEWSLTGFRVALVPE
ncbi:MAG: hypothetical protein AUG51_13635 [Acidobacteria bacterium 13_1_20CM_3_53_8]|nr:MAG: hypothetical protein AUG51_13635 [Acidobacteria bacterium 13_1_20CM_3_53_8]